MGGGRSSSTNDDAAGAAGAAGASSASGTAAAPALQVIVLGSGGGPLESNVTAFLVRSLASGWRRGSVIAVDAGVHLGAIKKILEDTQPPDLGQTDELSLPYTLGSGPFRGLELPHANPSANAAHIHKSLIDTYLITHPHLDHISGFVINTAGLPGNRPKRLAGLPSTIAAFKTHIFNNVIWPNLSDENNGAGLVTYMRLVEGGSPALGEGEGRGYLEISDGLAVKIWGVSHGHCIERHSHRGSNSSSVRHGSFDASSIITGPMGVGMGSSMSSLLSPRSIAHHNASHSQSGLGPLLLQQQREQERIQAGGGGGGGSQGGGGLGGASSIMGSVASGVGGMVGSVGESVCVYDSSAYFIRDVITGREILIFGDVEPDSISLSPRNQQVWQEAAPKIAAGKLAAIFIECSYDDSQSVDRLFGHLAPRFIVEEMTVLAAEVEAARRLQQQRDLENSFSAAAMERSQSGYTSGGDHKKRKREGDELGILSAASAEDPVSPRTVKPGPPRRIDSSQSVLSSSSDLDAVMTTPTAMTDSPHLATPTAELSLQEAELSGAATPMLPLPPHPQPPPLHGLKVVIIHVKDKLNDGPDVGDVILDELLDYEREAQLGCEYIISHVGQDLYL
ncbi:cAMP phosphodiesterases class-II-domain-containing protein [Lasiosphaeria miniovina]|uniref:cAMP phosphodiesterases class-II-domain-containing protein n=1 Tax=Lasiosphaeria miniovina TaxID=1954250 RepID=A0AA40DYK2_9PEZI|nr:cAMP phosphodiesterases class-II-domain-containing protein [Lasiosphaeria miniovina]KAK0718417.1 cAMP phosphodiesterases class-II-domain-containing protein [Lasiosphaeria miniovina]